MQPRSRTRRSDRNGTIAVMAAFMLVALLGMVAFAVDLGYLTMAHTELQRTADAAALAGTWELIESSPPGTLIDLTDEIPVARDKAVEFAGANFVCNTSPEVGRNDSNAADGDVVIGHIPDPTDPQSPMNFDDPDQYNAVQVTVRRTKARNGEVPLFFARVFGLTGKPMSAQATAALLNNIGGFQAPTSGGTVNVLPFALDQTTWDLLIDLGIGTDSYAFSAASGQVTSGSDGIREVNLYPQGVGSPGNRGTVDIGSSNNSTADIARQIVHGVSAGDLAYFPGGQLKFDQFGEVDLNGDTGISAGVKDELASIIGEPRVIPIFSSVSGPGNNATYTITKWVGVRIMYVKLTGSMTSKQVIVQPCQVVCYGAIPAETSNASYAVYSPVWLVR